MITHEDYTMSNIADLEYIIGCGVYCNCKHDPVIEDKKEDYLPYIEKLHPRKDYHRKPFWLRIRQNPIRVKIKKTK